MPKYLKTLILILLVSIPVYSLAKNQGSSQGQGQGTQQQTSGEHSKGNVLRVNEKTSEVSKYVQGLLSIPDRNGGIGEQVRRVARNQNQAQERIMEKVQKMESRGKLLKFVFGPHSESLAVLKEEMKQNQERTQTLKDLKLELWNSVDQETVQSLIDSLTTQDVALTQKILDEESAFSIFGALKALFFK